ncbi:DUF3667 domain-containing protein [Empedobacter brevis]|uniref:DUF3667 domain-containing protein n=1 Tax=Empedobacter brevis TaxID=247 RepID=UPI0028ADBC41|nr:DUF3667 domain-containing protein [Empedobacter brevis]
MQNKCLNCEQSIQENYCSNCGQITSTHRFSLKHFFLHDFVHGIFHFDKGFIFTIKELFTRPGHSIREYIQGKRVKHFNCFTAILLILTIEYFFTKAFPVDKSVFYSSFEGFYKVYRDYSKFIVFLAIPFFSFFSYLIFRKSNQNYTENLVLNTYLVCGWLVINLLQKIALTFVSEAYYELVKIVTIFMTIIYVYLFYYQYFSVFKFKVPLFLKVLIITSIILILKQIINSGLNDAGQYFLH